MIVIVNSSPLIALGRVNVLHVFRQLFGKIIYTSAILEGAEQRGYITSAAQLIAELRKTDIYLPEA